MKFPRSWIGVDVEERSMMRDEDFRVMVRETTKTEGSDRFVFIDEVEIAEFRTVQRDKWIRHIAHPAWQETELVLDRGSGLFLVRQTIQTWHEKASAVATVPRSACTTCATPRRA